jgi:hypothetical protein
MGSSGKKKTTMAKLMRESKLRERRLDKAARKDARKRGEAVYSADAPGVTVDPLTGELVMNSGPAIDGQAATGDERASVDAPAGEAALIGEPGR